VGGLDLHDGFPAPAVEGADVIYIVAVEGLPIGVGFGSCHTVLHVVDFELGFIECFPNSRRISVDFWVFLWEFGLDLHLMEGTVSVLRLRVFDLLQSHRFSTGCLISIDPIVHLMQDGQLDIPVGIFKIPQGIS
jgi:hypothetical protein